MKDNESTLTDADKEPMNKAIEKVKLASTSGDTAAIKQSAEELDSALKAFSKVLYDRASAGSAAPAPVQRLVRTTRRRCD